MWVMVVRFNKNILTAAKSVVPQYGLLIFLRVQLIIFSFSPLEYKKDSIPSH